MSRRLRIIAWVVLADAVVLGAIGQGLTASPGLGRMATGWFVVVAIASVILLVGQVAATAWAAHTLVRRTAPSALLPLLAWSAGVVIAGAAAAILFAPAALLVGIAAVYLLPAAADGRANAFAGFGAFRHAPWRASLVALGVIVFALVGVVVAVATGLFLTGVVGGIAMWLWFGIAGAILLVWSTRVWRRATR